MNGSTIAKIAITAKIAIIIKAQNLTVDDTDQTDVH
jgi:hypothetical protein